MHRHSIVKQSDVSHGTVLHYADDWSYGRNSLCGKPMRANAEDWERGHKRICGSCARIMRKRVELAHAQALRELSFEAGDTVQYIGTGGDDLSTAGVVESVDGGKLMIRWDNDDLDEMYAGRLVHFTRGDCDISRPAEAFQAQVAPGTTWTLRSGVTHPVTAFTVSRVTASGVVIGWNQNGQERMYDLAAFLNMFGQPVRLPENV